MRLAIVFATVLITSCTDEAPPNPQAQRQYECKVLCGEHPENICPGSTPARCDVECVAGESGVDYCPMKMP